jgi:hypothetical protein
MVVHHKMTYPKKPGFVMNLTEVHHKSPCSPGTGMKRISEKLIQGLEDSMIL